MNNPVRIFVYGTLRRLHGNPMHSLLGPVNFRGRATCRGLLYCAGSYPALVKSDGADDRVVGEVYELLNPAGVIPVLDEYEAFDPVNPSGSLFSRELDIVQLDNGEVVEAWLYYFNRPVNPLDRIPDGDFATWLGCGRLRT
jgi:gamma-glutamylcyclotransferase (GGCT)/AIG2-like uncharacterized protein YtfP